MHRATPLAASFRGYVSGGARALVHEADDAQQMQELKITIMKGETRDSVEHPQNYGFTGYPIKAEKEEEDIIKKSAEAFTQFFGGNRAQPVVPNLDDRRFRCRNFDEGEVAMYDDQQQKVHIMRKRIYSRSPFKIEHRVIKDEEDKDGHGRDPKASRDQKKDESNRLSTIVMDPEQIIIERTKPKDEGQQQQQQQRKAPGEHDDYQNDEPEKEYKKDPQVERLSQAKWTEKNIILTVYKDNRPHLVIDLNEDEESISLLTLREGKPNLGMVLDGEGGGIDLDVKATEPEKPNLVIEMNDREKIITIMTERDEKPHLKFQLHEPDNMIRLQTEQGGEVRLALEMDDENRKLTLRTNEKTAVILDHNAEKVLVGDKDADRPCAYLGSVTSKGHRIVSEVSQKVMISP